MPTDDNVIPFPGPAGAGFDTDVDPFALTQPTLLPRRPERARFTVRIDLDGIEPPIWRRLQLASDLTLDRLHTVVQIAMGWTDSHLHHFRMRTGPRNRGIAPFLTPFDREEGEDGIAEADVRLDEVLARPRQRLDYEYDFGDGWSHTIRLEKVEPWTEGDPLATCLDGRRACPPEDVGGIPGYGEMLAMLDGHTHGMDPAWVEHLLDWLPEGFDPEAFSIDAVNDSLDVPEVPTLDGWADELVELRRRVQGPASVALARLVAKATDGPGPTEGEVESLTRRYRHLLGVVGDGITLTGAGYLPPRIVEQLYRDLDMDDEWIGKGNREDQTAPVLYLRTSATALGLLRKARGRLTVTTVGTKLVDDPGALLRHIASRVPRGKPHEKDAGLIALLMAAAGRDLFSERHLAASIMDGLGWAVAGGQLDQATYAWSDETRDILRSLCGWRDRQHTALAARTLLRRA
ncbi:MAG: plasmid pRiA4b ORF-3 family protein [Micropruina sp.]|nr:plasmid pRiA4b ORF-3 family protein [Micropruina sp.]